MDSNVSKGRFAEDLACKFLKEKGHTILCRNFYTPHGEIDIIFDDGGQLVFAEVKSKYVKGYGLPEDEFTERKIERFNEAILEYLSSNEINTDDFRIDLIAMQLDEKTRKCKIRHYKGWY